MSHCRLVLESGLHCSISADPVGRAVTGIVGSNPDRSNDVCLCVSVLCCPV
jgi:hypothetical protein